MRQNTNNQNNDATVIFTNIVDLLSHIAGVDDSIEASLNTIRSSVSTIENVAISVLDNINKYEFSQPKSNKPSDNPISETNLILREILKTLQDALKPSKENDKNNQSILDRLKSYADVIKSLKENLNDKLLKRLEVFNKLLEKINMERVNIFGKAIEKFASIMDSLQKKILPVTLSILALAASFVVLSLVSASPMLIFNLMLLGGFLTLLIKNMSDKKAPKNMMQFAGGIAILTLAMFAMTEIPIFSMIKMLVFLGVFMFMIDKFNDTDKKTKMPKLLSFAFGISILTLAMFAMNEIPWEGVAKMIFFIAALGAEIILIDKFGGKGAMKGLPGFAFGIGLLVIAMYAMNELPISVMFEMVAFIALLGLSLKLYDSKSGVSMLMIGGGIIAISLGLMVYKKSGFEMVDGLSLAGTILAISLVTIVLGAASSLALIGAATLIVIGVSTLIVAGSLALISKMKFSTESIVNFLKASSMLALGMFAITPLAILGVIGATLMIPLGISAAIVAGSIALISALEFDEKKVKSFSSIMFDLALGFVKIMPLAALGAVASVLMIAIATASFLTASVLYLISKLNINDKKIDAFTVSMTKLTESYESIGLFSLGKSTLKAVMMMPIILSAYAAAQVFEKIQSLSIKENQITNFGVVLTKFLDVTTTAIANSVSQLEKAEPGIEALSKIVSVASQLVDVVSAYANMNYNEYAVKNGKLVLVATKKIGDKEIALVGSNVGKLIQGLLQPLAIISSDSDVWDFGNGVKVKNPFAGGWFGTDNNSGVNRLTSIGQAFVPLLDAISKTNNSPIITDANAQKNLNTAIVSIVQTLGVVFEKISKWDIDEVEESTDLIKSFFETFDDVDDKKFKTINDSFTTFLNSLSDKAKFETINANLTSLKNNFKDIVSTINTLNIDKAMALERNLKLMSEEKSAKALLEVVDKLKELIGVLVEKGTSEKQQKPVIYQNPQQQQIMREREKENKPNEFQELFSAVEQQLSSINSKLNGKLKVIMVDSNMNKI